MNSHICTLGIRLCVSVALLAAASSVAVADQCKGNQQKHLKGEFNFQTSSWVEPDGKFSLYYTCIFNMDHDFFLKVQWYIPGPPLSWVPPNDGLPFPRRSEDPMDRPLQGCLQYGHLGAKTVAEFLGDAKEESKTGDNREKECRKLVGIIDEPAADESTADAGEANSLDPPEEGWSDRVTIYFPSDTKRPQESMLKLDAQFGINNQGDKGYESYFSYEAQPYPGMKDANIGSVRFYPMFRKEDEHLSNAFAEYVSKESIQLDKEGSFSFLIPQADHYRLATMGLQFTNADNQVLALLRISVLSPVQQ